MNADGGCCQGEGDALISHTVPHGGAGASDIKIIVQQLDGNQLAANVHVSRATRPRPHDHSSGGGSPRKQQLTRRRGGGRESTSQKAAVVDGHGAVHTGHRAWPSAPPRNVLQRVRCGVALVAQALAQKIKRLIGAWTGDHHGGGDDVTPGCTL